MFIYSVDRSINTSPRFDVPAENHNRTTSNDNSSNNCKGLKRSESIMHDLDQLCNSQSSVEFESANQCSSLVTYPHYHYIPSPAPDMISQGCIGMDFSGQVKPLQTDTM
jgi:hypothetical protein